MSLSLFNVTYCLEISGDSIYLKREVRCFPLFSLLRFHWGKLSYMQIIERGQMISEKVAFLKGTSSISVMLEAPICVNCADLSMENCTVLPFKVWNANLGFTVFELEGCILHGILFNFPVKKGIWDTTAYSQLSTKINCNSTEPVTDVCGDVVIFSIEPDISSLDKIAASLARHLRISGVLFRW